MDQLSADAARKDFRRLLDVAHYQGRSTVITKFGQNWAAITPLATLHTAEAAAQAQARLAAEHDRYAALLATCEHQSDALARCLALLERLRTHTPPGTDPVADEHYTALQALVAEPPTDAPPSLSAELEAPQLGAL
jgi:antitoxin (DNA-binding transcriptional repressor) of toxin-antitoxin stability system